MKLVHMSFVFRAILMRDFRQFLFVIRCNKLVCEQSSSWHDNLLTNITAIGRCFRSLLKTLNAVVRCCSAPNRLKLRCSDFTFMCSKTFVVYLDINEGKQPHAECYWRVINGQSGESLYSVLNWLGNLKRSGRYIGRLTHVPETTRLIYQVLGISLEL